MIEQIKRLRVEIDGLAQLCKELKPIKDNAAIHMAIGHLGTIPVCGTTEEMLKERQLKFEEEYTKIDAATSTNTEEIKEAVKSLKLSKAWLGKILERIGNENPYGSGYKTVEDIVPTADVASRIEDYPVAPDHWPKGEVTKSHIEKVDWLRTEIKRLIDNAADYSQEVPEIELEQGFAYKYLCEARFWLGFELGRVRDESK